VNYTFNDEIEVKLARLRPFIDDIEAQAEFDDIINQII
jgi:hypothetical protein